MTVPELRNRCAGESSQTGSLPVRLLPAVLAFRESLAFAVRGALPTAKSPRCAELQPPGQSPVIGGLAGALVVARGLRRGTIKLPQVRASAILTSMGKT